jgi:hypothetical protein
VSNPPNSSVGGSGGAAPGSTGGGAAKGGSSEAIGAEGTGGGPFEAAMEVATIYDRLQKLENRAKEKKDSWFDSQLFSSVLSGIILAAFGFFLTGRLEQAAKERELNVQSAKEMQELLVKISTGSKDEAEAAAVSLTTYGRYSIAPLIENLQYAQRAVAAERGLQALALTNAKDLCDDLNTVLENRTQRYTAASHSAVIRVLGAADCREAKPALLRYADLIKRADAGTTGLAEYQQGVRDATASNVTQAKQDLVNTFKLLNVDYAF